MNKDFIHDVNSVKYNIDELEKMEREQAKEPRKAKAALDRAKEEYAPIEKIIKLTEEVNKAVLKFDTIGKYAEAAYEYREQRSINGGAAEEQVECERREEQAKCARGEELDDSGKESADDMNHHPQLAIGNYEDLNKLADGVTTAQGAASSHIRSEILPKTTKNSEDNTGSMESQRSVQGKPMMMMQSRRSMDSSYRDLFFLGFIGIY